MKPTAVGLTVRARGPDCDGAVSTFDSRDPGREFGYILNDVQHTFEGKAFTRVHWRLLRCAGCGRGGLAKFHDVGSSPAVFESFFPMAIATAPLPSGIPEGILKEYREAELCASVGAWRAASAMLRSVLEKTLKANGYTKGTLEAKVDEAGTDGVITAARQQKAHADIRVLGNEVVHDDWRSVDEAEVESALHYAQRVLEDFYDDRTAVEQVLRGKGRIT